MSRTLLAGIAAFLLLTGFATSAAPTASDRLAMGLPASGELRGELVELQDGAAGFLAILQPRQRGKARGGVILLHDRGTSANSLEVIRPLRLGLAEAGWDTLSLRLSLAGGGQADEATVVARLRSGLDWLKSREPSRLVVIALGDSAAAALAYASQGPPPELRALVLISAADDPQTPGSTESPLAQVRLPVLDVYAERDHRAVLDAVARRRGVASGNPEISYAQGPIVGASGGFFGVEDGLLSRIRGWLASRPEG